MNELVKIVVTVPENNASELREAIGNSGGGLIGNYDYTSFSIKGTGRFRPNKNAKPAIGHSGIIEEVIEERIEITCTKIQAKEIVELIKSVHPYEEPAIDIYPLLQI